MNLDSDVSDLSLSEGIKEENHLNMDPSPSNDANQEEIHPPTTNYDSEDKKNKWINLSLWHLDLYENIFHLTPLKISFLL